jgi:hypothetical protein
MRIGGKYQLPSRESSGKRPVDIEDLREIDAADIRALTYCCSGLSSRGHLSTSTHHRVLHQ